MLGTVETRSFVFTSQKLQDMLWKNSLAQLVRALRYFEVSQARILYCSF